MPSPIARVDLCAVDLSSTFWWETAFFMKHKTKPNVHNPKWLHTPRVEAKRNEAHRKRIADGDSFRTRWSRLKGCDYVTRVNMLPCEKCERPTPYEVEVMGRWARWCGCL